MGAIEGENDVIGARAAWAVGNMASNGDYVPAEAVPVLIKALKVDDTGVKQAAAHAIKEIVVATRGGQNGRFFGRGRGGFGGRSRN
jgi:hypothetical protein